MTNRRSNKTARWIGNVLLLAGAIGVFIWAGSVVTMKVWQERQSRIFDRQVATPQTGGHTRLKPDAIVGRLAIPRLNMRAMVREGTGDRTLRLAAGHIPGTALPGQPGNIGIAGHRDTLFRSLKDVAANDEITLETPHNTYVYRVESTRIVKPEQVEVLNSGPTRELTLVTCYPFGYVGSAPDRFIVKAQLVLENAGGNDIETPESPVHPKPVAHVAHDEIAFDVSRGHSRELVPGKIWFGLSSADSTARTVDGWVWVMPDRRTIWLKNAAAREPVIFYQDGGKRELVITSVAGNSASGYLAAAKGRG